MNINEDSSSHDQLLDAFRNIALEKDHIEERDLEGAQLSQQARQYIATTLPPVSNATNGVKTFDCT
jgi:hypothetical protein